MIDQLLAVVEQLLLHVPMIYGVYISVGLMKIPDLSMESAYACGGLFGAQVIMLMQGFPLYLQLLVALCASICAGGLVGATAGGLTAFGKLPHLLSTIITFGIFFGIDQLLVGTYVPLSSYASPLAYGSFMPRYPEMFLLFVIAMVVFMLCFWLFRTQIGYCFAIHGFNPGFFKQYGIAYRYIFILASSVSNGLVGLSGYLVAQSSGFAEITMGFGKILFCITALILGKAISRSSYPLNVWLPLIGTSAYFVLQQVLLKIGFNLRYFTLVQAVVLLAIMILFYRTKERAESDYLGI